MSRRLRVAHLVVQPVLVWDDGEEFTAGPVVESQTLPLSAAGDMLASLPAEVARLQAELEPPRDESPAG